MQKMTELEYLGLHGVASPISNYMLDKMRIPHGQTYRQNKQMQKENELAIKEYTEKRQKYINEYADKIKSGEIIKPSSIEQTIKTAQGHPDNESTQAAKRILNKAKIN